MNKQICMSLMILPICLYSSTPKMTNIGLLLFRPAIFSQTVTPLHFSPTVLSSRDDQTEDCLRTGGCKD
jgi:hypothetical protein